jgi:hypothetical protein
LPGTEAVQRTVSLGQKTPDEGEDVPQADLFLVQVTLDLDRYRTLFESDETVEVAEWEGIAYLFRATASGTRDSRVVKFAWRAVDCGRETEGARWSWSAARAGAPRRT